MTGKNQAKDVLNVPPEEEQGAEAAYGFDYQAHCAARLCLGMLQGHACDEIVCEHHEDILQIGNSDSPTFCQVKKRESAETWTLSILKDAIEKLFSKLRYRNVGQLIIYGSGRPSSNGDCSLAELIALLDRAPDERNEDWEREIQGFEEYFRKALGPEMGCDTIKQGLRHLKIDLSMPDVQAVEVENIRLTSKVISEVWGVEVTFPVAERAYQTLYRKVWQASHKPKLPRSLKRITRGMALAALREAFPESEPLAERPQIILDINAKLQRGKLEKYVIYALQMRMDAKQVKFELGFETTEWEDFKAEIAVQWEAYVSAHPDVAGAVLWKQLRDLLRTLGETWVNQHGNNLLGPGFTEGVFFDMMAVCEVEIGA